jgi:hypothetical protein
MTDSKKTLDELTELHQVEYELWKVEYTAQYKECARWRELYQQLRRAVETKADEWHAAAASVNQANSPSIYIECSGDIANILDEIPER